MKKFFLYIIIATLATFMVGCGDSNNAKNETKNKHVFTVYTTVYPLSYFTERIGGNLVQVESVYPAGSDEHTFDPTQKDMMALADADLFFYIGLGLEGFVDNAKKTLKNEDVTMIATADAISDEEMAINKEVEDEHGHDNDEDEHDSTHEAESHEEHNHGEFDPHVWISPKLSVKLATSIKDALIEKDPKNEATYTQNYEELVRELDQLDTEFQGMADASTNKTFFVSHAAFGYLAETYGLEQVAISGLNSQDEPSQQELTEIVELAKEKNIQTILFEQNVSSNLTKVVQNEIGADALTLHNLGVLTKQDINNEETYFTLMKQNLEHLKQALNSSK